ncbi:TlpA family protein disulfide reductase [Terrabacter sp. C0L_2]|uniref:TlpA family protein disulfide reductase n=1 Tax=Terrabacter sp. C0L_2 TaxID=3108389 RepID=UPI002ED20C6B|nr:TlpA disulfide reductase family protein [Terrabacter sp. C0L_2]
MNGLRRRHVPGARLAWVATGVAVLVTTAGCGTSGASSVAAQARSGDRKGYVSGDGSVERVDAADRGPALALAGPTVDGRTWSLQEHSGQVVVVNVWGSWCPPCITETPALEKAYRTLTARYQDVAFIGLDTKEGPESALAFIRANHVPYPSLAYDGGQRMLSLNGKAAATPTTLVLDRQHRIAARVLGPVTAATLGGLVEDVRAG